MYKNIGTDMASVALWKVIDETGQLFVIKVLFLKPCQRKNSSTLADGHLGVFTSKAMHYSFLWLLFPLKTTNIQLYWS